MTPDEPAEQPPPAAEQPPPAAGSAAATGATTYRSFLFADLRGYTAFIERAGNAAGVELVDDYLAITRAAVAEHNGAEIKVEGDGFHAVFPSASSAVMCGLAIVRAATEATQARPERPMNVGVGVDAGEAVETADGYIGSAVNIAARVCATAAANEVLVTETVRGITRASIPVDFVSRGRRRLKGIAEPVKLFAAVGDTPSARRPQVTWRELSIAAAVVILAIVVIALESLFVQARSTPTAVSLGTPSASARVEPSAEVTIAPSLEPTPLALAVGPLSIGQYTTEVFRPPFSFVISEPGWALRRSDSDALSLYHETEPTGYLDVAKVDELFTNPCLTDGGERTPTGSTAAELVEALQAAEFLDAGTPQDAIVGGRSGVAVDVDVSEGALAACGSFGGVGIPIFPTNGEPYQAQPGERLRFVVVDTVGGRMVFIQSIDGPENRSVPELEQFLSTTGHVIDSVTF